MTTASCQYPGVPVSRNSLVAYGPTLEVRVGFDASYRPVTGRVPKLRQDLIPALVDTGATESHVDTQLAVALELPYVGPTKVSGASGGIREHPTYLAQIYIPDLKITVYGKFASADLLKGKQPHAVILGRTLLQGFRMVYDGKKGTVLIGAKIPIFSSGLAPLTS